MAINLKSIRCLLIILALPIASGCITKTVNQNLDVPSDNYQDSVNEKYNDFLTPEYYLSPKGDSFVEEVNKFLHFAKLEPFHNPLQNESGQIQDYTLSPWRTFGTEIGPRGGQKYQYHPADDLYIGNRESYVNLYAVYDGYVSTYRNAPKYRHYLSIKKDIKDDKGQLIGKLVTLYAHIDLDLDETDGIYLNGKYVKKGELVSKHLFSGTLGGPHLHFEIRYYRPNDLGTEDFYGSAFGPGGKNAGLTKPSAGDWSLGNWYQDKGYGFGNPKNFGLIF